MAAPYKGVHVYDPNILNPGINLGESETMYRKPYSKFEEPQCLCCILMFSIEPGLDE